MIETLHAYRAALLWFDPADAAIPSARYEADEGVACMRDG